MDVFKKIQYLHKRLERCQANVDAIKRSINEWGKVPLYQRKDKNPKAFLETEPRMDILAERVAHAGITSVLIDRIMYENAKLFFDIPRRLYLMDEVEEEEEEYPDDIFDDKKDDEGEEDDEEDFITAIHRHELLQTLTQEERDLFRAYETYVDQEITQQLLDAVITSLTYLKMEIENRYENDFPIFEILMELQEPHVTYFLNLDPTSKAGFTFHVETLLDDMYHMMEMLPRTAQDPAGNDDELLDFGGNKNKCVEKNITLKQLVF